MTFGLIPKTYASTLPAKSEQSHNKGMSNWVTVHGFMILKETFPYEKLTKVVDFEEDNNDIFYSFSNASFSGGYTNRNWVYQLLIGAREDAISDRNRHGLPKNITLEWDIYNDGDDVEDVQDEHSLKYRRFYEDIEIPEEDCIKAKFPSGSEGPLMLTVTTCFDYDMPIYHVVFSGSLRDQCSLDFIKDWWDMMKKYSNMCHGHIYATNGISEWENTAHL